jgi:hypothetical protein
MGVCLVCKHDPCVCDAGGDDMPKPPNKPLPGPTEPVTPTKPSPKPKQ